MALGEQVKSLRRLAERSVDKHKKQLLLELVSHAQELENEYVMETGDPTEAALLSMLLYVYEMLQRTFQETSSRQHRNQLTAQIQFVYK